MKIGFIGLGNMAKAMIGGILRKNIISPEDILGYARTKETRDRVSKEYGITICESNEQVAQQADILFLAVKPQMFGEVIPLFFRRLTASSRFSMYTKGTL